MFDYETGHISLEALEYCIKQSRPYVGFNRFCAKVLENPKNRNVQKTNIKDKYSKIYVGDDTWELALDCDVFPIMCHHMTTAALSKMEKHRATIPRMLRQKAAEFTRYIDEVNTTDEGRIYDEAVERIKLIIVNLCTNTR